MTMQQIGLESVLVDKGFQAGLAKMDSATLHTSGNLSSLGNVMTTAVGTAIGFLTAQAIPKLVDGLGDFIRSAAEAEKIEKGLDAVLASTAGQAGVTKQAALDLANGFAKLTTFEDDSIVAAESVLLRFKEINRDTFPRATELTLDLATALGMDATNAAKLLGKALEDPTQGIGRLRVAGVNLTDAQEKMVKEMVAAGNTAGAQKLIMDELTASIGGAAKAAGTTAEGQWKILQNQLGNVKETIGAAFLPALTTATKFINENVIPAGQKWADENIPKIMSRLGELGDKAQSVKTLIEQQRWDDLAIVFWNWIDRIQREATQQLDKISTVIDDWVHSSEAQETFRSVGDTVGKTIVDEIGRTFESNETRDGLVRSIWNMLNNLKDAGQSAFENFGAGVATGIVDGIIGKFIPGGVLQQQWKDALIRFVESVLADIFDAIKYGPFTPFIWSLQNLQSNWNGLTGGDMAPDFAPSLDRRPISIPATSTTYNQTTRGTTINGGISVSFTGTNAPTNSSEAGYTADLFLGALRAKGVDV